MWDTVNLKQAWNQLIIQVKKKKKKNFLDLLFSTRYTV